MPLSDGLQQNLRNLLLEAFADGETVSGTWKAETARDDLPDWRVEVERVDSTDSGRPVTAASCSAPTEEDPR
ncbi:hypothetical protein [Halorussus lipolyticus]|uniref:hypothetical protein n=1 Tax=Halorussus lipolyticus TaxID=3034024 RepID=UPI0023E7F349|nr:hypothetical protein [Halorussus sp. DT80]